VIETKFILILKVNLACDGVTNSLYPSILEDHLVDNNDLVNAANNDLVNAPHFEEVPLYFQSRINLSAIASSIALSWVGEMEPQIFSTKFKR